MVFSSLSFLFFFLPCTALLYYLGRGRRWRNGVLLAASLLFYAWGEPRALLTLLAVAAVAYLGALGIEQWKSSRPGLAKGVYVLCLVLILLNLFVFKYLNFTLRNLEKALDTPLSFRQVALPIGISFYTFQTLSYVIDLYRGRIRVQRSPLRLLLYISLFPQLIAGPIVRYQTVEEELRLRQESTGEFAAGFRRFAVGLGKKVLLANNVALICEAVYGAAPSQYGTGAYWLAALAYTLQIYFDFSGYSDMAIGLGRMFGFHFLENFDYPYISLSVTEFWRRWHISLSSWFRDYVYIPLGGNRVSRRRWIFNILTVWMLTGFWHGAEWNSVLWGLYYALLLMGEKLLWGKALARAPRPLRWLYSFLLVTVGWVLFYHSDFSALRTALEQMFCYRPTTWLGGNLDARLLLGLPFLPAGLLLMLPWKRWAERKGIVPAQWLQTGFCLCLLLLSVLFILSSSFNPFIYFRF